MSTYCQIIPDVKNKPNTPSKLFQDLNNIISNREIVKQIYSIGTSSKFLEKYGDKLIYDKNGEPTIESLLKYVKTKEIKDSKFVKTQYNYELNKDINDKNITLIAKRAIDFNKNSSNYVATVITDKDGRSIIDVVEKTKDTQRKAKSLETTYKAFEKIDDFLKKKGIDIKWIDSSLMQSETGLLMPENLNKASTGLFGVINIANNFEGFKVLTEEFSHFIIENLKNTPIIERAENLLKENPDMTKQILGDEYNSVVEYYKNRNTPDLVTREALGRMMADLINKGIETQNSLFNRAKNTIINFIYKVFRINSNEEMSSIQDIEAALSETLNDVWEKDTINNDTLRFFEEFGNTLAHTTISNDKISKQIESARENIIANMLKYIQVYRPIDDEEQITTSNIIKKQLDNLVMNLKETTFLETINDFAKDAIIIMNQNFAQLREIRDMKTFSGSKMKLKASALLQIKALIDTYREPIIDYKNICEEIIRITPSKEILKNASELKALLGQVQECINNSEEVFLTANRNFLIYTLAPYFEGKDGIKYRDEYGVDRVITISQVIDFSMGDLNLLNRFALAASNTDDLWVQLVDYFIQQQKEKGRQVFDEHNNTIKTMDATLRAKMSRKTDWMYARKADGTPTGYLISEYDFEKYNKALREERSRIEKTNFDDSVKKELLEAWILNNTDSFELTKTYTNKKGESKEYKREYRVPKKTIYGSNALKNLSQAQREYYDAYMKKKWEFDWYLPKSASHPFQAVQMRMTNIAEAALTSKQGITGGITNILSTFKNEYIATSDLDSGEYGGIHALLERLNPNSILETHIVLRFDKTPYRSIPIYFVKMLDDMSKLSTDATTALQEYGLMATNYKYMHDIVDIIELIREQNAVREIKTKDLEEFEYKNDVVSREAKIPTKSSNVYNRVEDVIDVEFYNITKNQGFFITQNMNSAKIADTLMKYSSFSMLGFNMYSGVNNVFAGKYQMFIEACGGEYFNLQEALKAEGLFFKMCPEMIADLKNPYSFSKLQLLIDKFNVGQHYKESIRNSKTYKSAVHNVASKLTDSSILLDLGETNIQCVTAIAFLLHYKLYKDPIKKDKEGNILNKDYVSLFDALKVEKKKIGGTIVGAELVIDSKYKNFYTKDNEKINLSAGSKQLTQMTLLIGKINQDMHGIFNKEDMAVAQKYTVGRLAFMYRRHLIPQLQKRFKSFGKRRGIYNFKSKQVEEGYYVTAMRTLGALIFPEKSSYYSASDVRELKTNTISRWELLSRTLSKHQKSNLRRFFSEMSILATLAVLSAFLKYGLDMDDDDEWIHRQLFYQVKRLQLEGTAYFPPHMLESMMNILISPTAVISPIQKWMNVANAIPQRHDILKSGPYKGHSKLYANIMRALPVYPHVKSFIELNKNDSRFKVFNYSLTEQGIYNALKNFNDGWNNSWNNE